MVIDGYRLRGQLGAGLDGVSYLAEQDGRNEPVVVCVLNRARDNPDRWPVLCRRLTLAGRLTHPHSRRILKLGLWDDPPFVALRLSVPYAGTTRAGPSRQSAADAVFYARAVVGALAEAHRLGLVHGGIDPWSVAGTTETPAHPMIDFSGLNHGDDPDSHNDGLREAFRAPEVLAGEEPTDESDVYSLAAVMFWLITGETPSAVSGAGRNLPPVLRSLLTAMLALEPEDRPLAQEVSQRLADMGLSWGDLASAPERTPGARSDLTAETSGWASSIPAAFKDLPTSDVSDAIPALIGIEPPLERLGRYRLLGRVGQGGMGEVFRAIDEADGREVAIKLLLREWSERPNALRRFRKEARLLARVRNPYVTNLLELNEDEGRFYIVLEYVAGEPLDRVLMMRGPLDEPTALAIAADVARGLIDAHRLGIVHRDIKPSNVLLVGDLPEAGALPVGSGPLVKLSDFGLARQAVSEESVALTQTGMIMGTPAYMAPEQCAGRTVDARTDVYALGATLFQMVTGRPPFEAIDSQGMLARHLNDPPPPLRSINPDVSDGLARVVEKALAKDPAARYDAAGAMLADLDRLLRGEPTGLPLHPLLPEGNPERVLHFDFQWELEAPPRALWPYVSNTDRIDRAIGFAAVRYTLTFDPAHGVRRFFEGRKVGMIEAGEEYPYEWVEGRRLGVFREFSRGPFHWLVSVVDLAPRIGGGTLLTHHLRLDPRGLLMRLGSRWGVGSGLKRDLERVYRRIDATVFGRPGPGPAIDPFEPPTELTALRRRRLDDRLALLSRRGVSPDLIHRLGEFLTNAPAPELARIRPLELATRLGMPAEDVISACLHGASVGLFVLRWDLLCPVCRLPSEVKDTLKALAEHGHCEACHVDYRLDFTNSVELTFQVDPRVREADTNTYCAAGPAHSPHVVAQVRLSPGERMDLDLELSEGTYRLRGPQLGWTLDFRVRPAATARRWDLGLSFKPSEGVIPEFGTGGQVLGLNNDGERPLLIRVERITLRDDVLTAARASALAVFRELFPAEVLAPGRLVTVGNVALMITATGLEPTELYERLGDVRAFASLHEQFLKIDRVVRDEGGTVVKALGEGIVAAFHDPEAAVRAALRLPEALALSEATRGLGLRVAIHQGPAMAATLNDHLDYFGATVRQALNALTLCPAGSLVLTHAMASDPQVADRLGRVGTVLMEDRDGPLLRVNFADRREITPAPADRAVGALTV